VKIQVTREHQMVRVITESGIEGNYSLIGRYWHPAHKLVPEISYWSSDGWLELAKQALIGRSALDRAKIVSRWWSRERRTGEGTGIIPTIDICLWDILGKAVSLPIYQLLGACRERVMGYGSTGHLETVEAYVELSKQSVADGFRALKIHPARRPTAQQGPTLKSRYVVDHKLDIEVCRAVREAVGDDVMLLLDPVAVYDRFEAMEVGRALDDLNFYGYEDPLPSTDLDGLVQLSQALDVPLIMGELFTTFYQYGEYIRRGAVDVLRISLDSFLGITGGMRVAHLAECFGMKCEPHNWGDTLQQAAHFHCELAMDNCDFYEMRVPQGSQDLPHMKDQIRMAKDGYVYAPTKPGLGYDIDWDKLDDLTIEIKS
jgi:L-alanine-DL-glutamate epimerase-like enolase superfamily enzyme